LEQFYQELSKVQSAGGSLEYPSTETFMQASQALIGSSQYASFSFRLRMRKPRPVDVALAHPSLFDDKHASATQSHIRDSGRGAGRAEHPYRWFGEVTGQNARAGSRRETMFFDDDLTRLVLGVATRAAVMRLHLMRRISVLMHQFEHRVTSGKPLFVYCRGEAAID